MPTTDPQSFMTIIGPHLGALYRAAYRLCRSRADAEDLVQEVCLRAYGNEERFSQTDSPRAWLLRVQYNLYVDAGRRDRRTAADSLDAPQHPELEAPGHESPERHAEAACLGERLTRAWHALNPDQRMLLALHAEGYTLAEMTRITQLPLGALKARLHRARTRLGKLLETQGERPRMAAASGESR